MLPAIKDLILEGPGQRQIYKSHPSVFQMPNGVPTRLTASLPIITLSFRVLTPSLLHLVAAVSMPWCRIGVERITGFALRWVSSWTPFEFSRLVPAAGP